MRDTRKCLANVRTVHCVASGGLVLRVASKIFFSNSGVNVRRGRFRVGLAVNACTPPVPYVARAAITVGRDRPSCFAIERFDIPSWASRITRHFCATPCGVVPERTNDSSCLLASSSTERASAVANMPPLNHGQPTLSTIIWDGTLERRVFGSVAMAGLTGEFADLW